MIFLLRSSTFDPLVSIKRFIVDSLFGALWYLLALSEIFEHDRLDIVSIQFNDRFCKMLIS